MRYTTLVLLLLGVGCSGSKPASEKQFFVAASQCNNAEPYRAAQNALMTKLFAEAGGVKAGLLINATRVAIVGQAVAPPLFDTMVVLGKQRVVQRLRDAVAGFGKP